MSELSVLVLAYNEAENVAPVLAELTAWLAEHEPDAEIVFIDDGSTDGTSEVATRALAGFPGSVVRHAENRGMGAAIKTGVRHASGAWVTFLPADGQISPAAIGTLRAASRGVELVLSVYDHRDDGLARAVLSRGVRTLIQVVHGVRLRSDGPYLFRRSLFDAEQLPPDTFFLNFELPIRAIAAGIALSTVTIECRPRRAGHSKSTGVRRVVGVAKDLLDLRRRRFGRALDVLRGGRPRDPIRRRAS